MLVSDQTNVSELKRNIPFSISEDELISLSLDITRVADSKITKAINDYKIENQLKLSSLQKNEIRSYILGKSIEWRIKNVSPISVANIINQEDINKSLNTLLHGIKRDSEKVLGTLKTRLDKQKNGGRNAHYHAYSDIISAVEKNKNQLLIFHFKANEIHDENILLKQFKTSINQEYDKLSNYHQLAIVFENIEDAEINWSVISKIAIFCENFKHESAFRVFNKNKTKKITELNNFLKHNENIKYDEQLEKSVYTFYQDLSYGFQFNDLMISDDGTVKILIFQKVQLDESVYPCPECFKKIVRGNSYPKLLQRSFECQNPNCSGRSKIGRGKRFDLLGVKRNLTIELNHDNDRINPNIAKKFRRDIFNKCDPFLEMLIKFYSWDKSTVRIIQNFEKPTIQENFWGRKIVLKQLATFDNRDTFADTPIESLFLEIIKHIEIKKKKPIDKHVEKRFSIYKGNSANLLSGLNEKISGAITSPPYYNAREYSQWPTFICYLTDMAINALAVYNKMEDESFYFYNIGDIVGQDNIYVSSHMSKRRLMLGFYTTLIFDMIGYNFVNNIIWDKGEVQSKRNSTENRFPGYIKPINCYEHILIFSKKFSVIKLNSKVLQLDAVKKINSKGENILGHTAPYPEKLVKLIFDFINKDGYLLDPYLGSGTTIIAGIKNSIKSVGIEADNNYYKLALKRILSLEKNKQLTIDLSQ